jgi:hypothetical protein
MSQEWMHPLVCALPNDIVGLLSAEIIACGVALLGFFCGYWAAKW